MDRFDCRGMLVFCRIALAALGTLFFISLARPVQADGIILPEDSLCGGVPSCPPQSEPLEEITLQTETVSVDINNQLARTQVDQVFYNPNNQSVEGVYLFPLPNGSTLSQVTVWVDGQPVQAQVLGAEAARDLYETTVQNLRDPALVEYIGRSTLQVSLYPIPAKSERTIRLEYLQPLISQQGLVQYTYPLKRSREAQTELSVSVQVHSQEPIRAVYSPTHALDVERTGAFELSARLQASGLIHEQDFSLMYSAGETQAFHLLTYRDAQDTADPDGTFLLMLAPQPTAQIEPTAKDVLLVLDRSGSMDGVKFNQAQTALASILTRLNPQDRFYVSTFNDTVQAYADELLPASEALSAIRWISALNATGGTDINQALQQAAEISDAERPAYLIFLTDGLPTVGETDSAKILTNFSRSRTDTLRLFPFGVGYDVDTFLLDSLSIENHGRSAYILPGAPLDQTVSDFYATISAPVLTDVSIDFGALEVYDVYPQPLPDLFAGAPVILVGRYRQAGAFTVTVSGSLNGQPQQFTYPQQGFSGDDTQSDAAASSLNRLWATRKIGVLLNQMRLSTPNEELIAEITRLSLLYGILTPYTSYLVEEPYALDTSSLERLNQQAYAEFLSLPEEDSGQTAVENAIGQGALANALNLSANPAQGETTRWRTAGGHTFLLQDGLWVDTRFSEGVQTLQSIEFLSPAYFDLAASSSPAAEALALGQNVLVVIGGQAYQVVSPRSTRAQESHPLQP